MFGSIEQGKVSRDRGHQKVLIQVNASLSFMGYYMFKSFSWEKKHCFRSQLLAPQSLSFLSVVGLEFSGCLHSEKLMGRQCGCGNGLSASEKDPLSWWSPVSPLAASAPVPGQTLFHFSEDSPQSPTKQGFGLATKSLFCNDHSPDP